MMDGLLSAKFAASGLNDAVVVDVGSDPQTDADSMTYSTRATVSVGGFWGWLGWREHTSATLSQQNVLFEQLKAELRENYLGEERVVSERAVSDARRLNHAIDCAEKNGSYRGSDREQVFASTARLAAIMRIERDMDRIAAKKQAFLSPRMIADFKRRAEIQFGSLTMREIQGYRAQTTGTQVSCRQSFDALSDYKSLLQGTEPASSIIRFGESASGTESQEDPAGADRAADLMLIQPGGAPAPEQVAHRTLAHCLASLKHAYFRVSPDSYDISTKELAFDREVSKYVERQLVDRTTGRLCELTKSDFFALEKLAFENRSSLGHCERPLNEMFDQGGATARSRYSGFTLDKEAGVVHLINSGERHAIMFIETFDPAEQAWHLAQLHFGTAEVSRGQACSLWQRWMSDEVCPGTVKLSQATVIHQRHGTAPRCQSRDLQVIATADRQIGKRIASAGTDAFTSIRLPAGDIKKLLDTARDQHQGDREGMQGNVAFYHLQGRSLSSGSLYQQRRHHQKQQAEVMLELARMEMLLDKIHAFAWQTNQAEHAKWSSMWRTSYFESATAQNHAGCEDHTPVNCPSLTLLDSLRAEGVLAALSDIPVDSESAEARLRSITQRLTASVNGWKQRCAATRGDWPVWRGLGQGLKDKAAGASNTVASLLDSTALCADERLRLQALSEKNIDSLIASLWRNQRAIYHLSRKIDNLSKIESFEFCLKAARKELEMRKVSATLADALVTKARNRLDTAARDAKTDNGGDGVYSLNQRYRRASVAAYRHAARVAEQEEVVAVIERQYNDLSADMIKGADGYTATDAKGRRAVRASNCAEWLRNMLQLAGVTIEGIDNAAGSVWVPESLRAPDPRVLAGGRYDSFRSGFARAGLKLHEPPKPSVREVAPQARTAASAAGTFLSAPRLNGAQYDIFWP